MATGDASAIPDGPSPGSYEPTKADIRVNTFWFLGLIFSLSSALIGIILLQWLREHQRPTQTLQPRTSVAMIHMNEEAFEKYFVYQIFTSLPLLLIAGLLLFFIGLVDFLWHINRTVAGPPFAAIALILTFLALTTIIPGLQGLPGYPVKHRRTKPAVPCPYKSPQAWAFIKFTDLVKRTLKRIANCMDRSSGDFR